MQKKKAQPIEDSGLRHQAEELLSANPAEPHRIHTRDELLRLDHELDVHKIELEMQNDELRKTSNDLEALLGTYTDLYDFAPVGYCTIDRKGSIRAANLTAAKLFGIERSTMIGQDFRHFVAPKARMVFPAFIEKVFASQGNESCELKLAKTQDTPCYVRLEARVLDSSQDCRIVITDVTGRKRAEEQFHQTRSRLMWVLEKLSIGTWLNELSQESMHVDDQAKKLLYIDPDVELKMDLFWNRIHPDDRAPMQLAIENSIKDHTYYDVEHRTVDPVSGNIRWCRSTGQAMYAGDGIALRFDGLIYDITDRKEAEDKLQMAYDELEKRVTERTSDLNDANTELKRLKNRLQAENTFLKQDIEQNYNFGEIIGQSDALAHVFFRVEQVALLNATVLLMGETGTGKGMVARAIHSRSSRKNRPLMTVNCTTLPATLIEAELFGRERGAFTGSDARQIGRFELADGGTIFLDEIGELPMDLQCKLLRVIQDGEFERLGSPRTIKTDVRIIAATNRNLDEEIRNGRFREDLFYRLNVFPITMPPLRQRKDDIPLLVNHFVVKFNKKIGKKIMTVTKDTLKILGDYHWPGNVRELESVIERAVILSQGDTLQVLDRFETFLKLDESDEQEVKDLARLERDHIVQVLQKTNWRIEGNNGAAIILGLNPSTLRARMRKLGVVRY